MAPLCMMMGPTSPHNYSWITMASLTHICVYLILLQHLKIYNYLKIKENKLEAGDVQVWHERQMWDLWQESFRPILGPIQPWSPLCALCWWRWPNMHFQQGKPHAQAHAWHWASERNNHVIHTIHALYSDKQTNPWPGLYSSQRGWSAAYHCCCRMYDGVCASCVALCH